MKNTILPRWTRSMQRSKNTRERKTNSFENWKPNTHPNPQRRNFHHPAVTGHGVIWNSKSATKLRFVWSSSSTRTRRHWRPKTFGACALAKSLPTRLPGSPCAICGPRSTASFPAFAFREETSPRGMVPAGPPFMRPIANTVMPGGNSPTNLPVL